MGLIRWNEETLKKFRAFQKKKRAYYSLIILASLTFLTLFAETFVSSRPLIVSYNGKTYFPALFMYTDQEFGGFLETEANYSDPFIKEEITKGDNWAIYPLIPWDYGSINFDQNLQHPSPPSSVNYLGTDNRGRDVLARLIYGFRISVMFALILAFIEALIGIFVGAIEGYFGGWTDLLGQRVIEIWAAIPSLYALILIASLVQPNIPILITILSLFGWIGPQALVRVEFLKARNLEYVKAARSLGVGSTTIIRRHILPNALTMVITRMPFSITGAMTALVSLDFLGMGVPAPTPSMGESLKQGLANLEAWWIGMPTIGVLIVLLVLITFIGEAVLDVFDPKRN